MSYARDERRPSQAQPITDTTWRKPVKLVRWSKHMPHRDALGTRFCYAIFDYGGEELAMGLFPNLKTLHNWRYHQKRYIRVMQTGYIRFKKAPEL